MRKYSRTHDYETTAENSAALAELHGFADDIDDRIDTCVMILTGSRSNDERLEAELTAYRHVRSIIRMRTDALYEAMQHHREEQ